ncbi:hypothetical protein SteCoe_3055 [Stentor coeruleus]|uniref:Ubiquitin-like domain-containing protein n=1 Tax=Stentor coeruleus TaxID=5963 RepID=A0A1R2CXY7_9CILI|nr:hypothetical protein SteCoe_3055 [Stentor coeruleus]
MFPIFVKTLTGETLTIDVCADYDVEYIKEVIEEKLGIFVEQQRLIWAGREIFYGTICSQNIAKESTLHVIFRFRGGD